MNTTQEQLLHLLTLALHSEVPIENSFSSINGEELFDLALQQNVLAFLYPTLNNHRQKILFDELIIHRWKVATLHLASRQMRMINEIRYILDLFRINGIPVISLKGLALKQVYPHPELRNTNDLDLLIKETDIQKSIELLSTQGYHPSIEDLYNPNYMHIEMQRTGTFSVELHRTLWHPTIMKKRDDHAWIKHIWENRRQQEIEEFQLSTLSLEDEFIHLIIHLARHFMHSGANLQQLCDIVLFIKVYWDSLNKEYIDQTIISMNLFTFYQYILTTCHFYLGLTLPATYNILDKNKSKTILIDILNSKKSLQAQKRSNHIILGRNNKFLIPLTFILEAGRSCLIKIKITLHRVTFIEKCIRSYAVFNKKSRFHRSIGL